MKGRGMIDEPTLIWIILVVIAGMFLAGCVSRMWTGPRRPH